MILFPHRSLFIHIPRTSGIALTELVMRHVDVEDSGVTVVTGDSCGPLHRHARACELRYLVPAWHALDRFAVIRNPWRLVESTYRYWWAKRQQIERGESIHVAGSPLHQIAVDRTEMTFAEFVMFEFQYMQDGFWRHWCCDESGADLGVRPVRFEHLNDIGVWSSVLRALQLPAGTSRPPRINSGASVPCKWTHSAIDFIRDRCRNDLQIFGYPDQPHS